MDIAIDKVRELIVEARRLEVKEGDTDPDSGSNPIDDGQTNVLTSSEEDDGAEKEFRGIIAGMNVDERADLLALLYIGRGDFEVEEWDEALTLAKERDAASGHLANYLIGTPNFADLLDEGFAAIGDSFEDTGEMPAPDISDTDASEVAPKV
jgi:hypothetical protein